MYHHFAYKYFSNYFSHSGFQLGAVSIVHPTPRDIGNIWGYSGSYSWEMKVAVGVTGIWQYRAGMLMHLEMHKLSTFSIKLSGPMCHQLAC